MVDRNNKQKKNPGESIRQRLKNLSEDRERPFDEILRYYAMERFLYRLSVSPYAEKFHLLPVNCGKFNRSTRVVQIIPVTKASYPIIPGF